MTDQSPADLRPAAKAESPSGEAGTKDSRRASDLHKRARLTGLTSMNPPNECARPGVFPHFPFRPPRLRFLLPVVLAAVSAVPLAAQIGVWTHRYDPARAGANLSEAVLTPANVKAASFGRLYSYPVDGSVYAQPLYVPQLAIGGASHNVLFIATMNDQVYAFDADSGSAAPLWRRDFTAPPAVTPVPITDITAPDKNIVGHVGIQSTPVIDMATGAMFLVARTKENGAYVQRLHALDIMTGASKTGSPVTITGTFPGNAPDAVPGPNGPVVEFNPKMQSQRAALALTNGVVLISWAGHEDLPPYHGWIMGYDAATLAKVGTFCVTPDFYYGGIWQGGRAPTIDAAGNAYFTTGNGEWDGVRNFGDSVLKFGVSRSGLTLLDYFTPGNYQALAAADHDLSGSGFTLFPAPDDNHMIGGGKEGTLYVLDANKLGHMVADDSQIPQRIPVSGGHVMGGAVYWTSSSAGTLVYNWSEDDVLRGYRLSSGKLALPGAMQGAVVSPGHPGGSLTLTANGSTAGTGIVWASMPTSQDGIHGLVAGVLRAFNAETLDEIWNSEQNPSRDRVGTLMKFVPPVVVGGKVFLPNHDGAVSVYGPLTSDFTIAVSPGARTIPPGTSGTFTATITGLGGFAGRTDLSVSGAPSGTTVTFSPASVTGSGTSTMTVAVPSSAAASSFSLAVTGTSGGESHTAPKVVVNVNTTGAGLGAIGINF